ncbi:MAG: Nramp family divalent metal transporter [Coriobacteriia bacterium]|nr:Nramp family divalent metal transporter [Coriobacteriia bacterium]
MARTPRQRGRLLLFLGVLGPGIVAASAGNDPGGISTYSVAGARYGYMLLWALLAMTPSFVFVQEMAGRMGAVTGKGFAGLIREKFGMRPSFFAMACLLSSTAATSVAEFAGIAAAMQLFGVSKYVAVPVAAAVVWLLVVRGSYRSVEKVLLAMSTVFVAYVVAAFLAGPDWGQVLRGLTVPRVVPSTEFVTIAIGMTGTTIAPWMQFLLQSNIVDKGISIKEWRIARLDVIVGAISANIVAAFIIVTTATVLHPAGITVTDAGQAARALTPLAGQYATLLFSLGFLSAAVLSAAVLPLTAAYAVCEAFGLEAGLDRAWSEAPVFNWLYTLLILFGAAFILIPGLHLITVLILSQVVNGILLPFLLFFMIRIVNDRRIMGRHVNGPVYNVLSWATIVVVVSLTAVLLGMTALGVG